jgi:ADP-heptose:LPS heptosyltransferase
LWLQIRGLRIKNLRISGLSPSIAGNARQRISFNCAAALIFIARIYMNRIKDYIYTLIGLLARTGWRRKNSSSKTLIIRVDEIGDYMLWRPFLHELAAWVHSNQSSLHFCGNQSWKKIFDTLDNTQVDYCFWLDKIRFKKDMRYRFRFLRSVWKQGYQVVINPTFSRDKRNDDAIVIAVAAAERIGMSANQESVRAYEKGYDTNLYTKLFDYPERPLFELYRNRLFTESVTGKTSAVQHSTIDTSLLPAVPEGLPARYFVVFPGSRSAKRIWPAEHFQRVADYLFDSYGWIPVLAGAASDRKYADAFLKGYSNICIDLTGKTSLPQMLSVLAKAQCLLSVDTGSVHLAAAVGCPVFGAFNGSQYGRFAPYPAATGAVFYAVYPDEIEKELADPEIVRKQYQFVVTVPYSLVKPEKMILALHNHFSQSSY